MGSRRNGQELKDIHNTHPGGRLTSRIHRALLLAGLLFAGSLCALGQMNTGEIDGIVKDPTDAIIVDATVAATESSTQLKYTTKTNASGEFLLAQLPVGEYSLTVTLKGSSKRCSRMWICMRANACGKRFPWNSENKANR